MIVLSLGVCWAACAQEATGPIVAVTGGQVQGRPMPAGGASFKGIPYAAPPSGMLRWRETQPLQPWVGVRQAAQYRAGCGQKPDGSSDATEDCLFLNVWTPDWPIKAGKGKPVMLWINGGELFGGSGALRPGSESLTRHGVVLVSANYRGTLLGMMGHPDLTAESPHHSSANYMFYDELAVLKWIRANIAKFGGDPTNVTIFSQSGGAHLSSMLLASPMTKGLIHRAIVDSGAPLQATRPYLRLDQLETIGKVTAEVLKAPPTGTLAYLRGLPAATVVAAMPAVRAKLLAMSGLAYDEGTDDYVIAQPPGEVWTRHREAPVPLIVGSTAQDTAGTIRGVPIPGPAASPGEAAAYEKDAIGLFYGKHPDLVERAERLYGLRGTPSEVSSYPPYGTPQQQLGTDLNHRCSTVASARSHSSVAPTYMFEFSRIDPAHLPTHGSELAFIFGYADLSDPAMRAQSDLIQRYWTNFAKTGDPNGAGLPRWPRYDAAGKGSIEFTNDGPVARGAVRAAACAPYVEQLARDAHPLTGGEGTEIRGPAINGMGR